MPPITGRKDKNLGLQRPPVQNLPFVNGDNLLQPVQNRQQNFTQEQTQQGNTNVLGAAQNLAQQGAVQPNKTLGLVEQQTQNLLSQPQSLITDKNVQSQLDAQTRRQGDAFQQFRQSNADTSNTGATRGKAFNLAMTGAQALSDSEQKLKKEQSITNRQALLENLKLGQDVAKTSSADTTERLNRLLATRERGEGERAQTVDIGQQDKALDLQERLGFAQIASGEKLAALDNDTKLALAELGGKIQQGLQISDQEFQSVEQALNRSLKQALADGNNDLAREIETMRGDLQREGFASSEKVAFANIASDEKTALLDNETKLAITELQGKIQEGLQLSDQDFKSLEGKLEREMKLAIANDDRELALSVENMRNELARAGLASQEKVAFARITSDENMQAVGIDAQTELTELQGRINNNELLTKLDFEESQNALDRELQTAINNNDNETRLVIENMQASLKKEMQAADQKYNSVENAAHRAWSSSERIDQNTFDSAEKLLDRELEIAEALKDRAMTEKIESDRVQLQLKMQTNDMTHEEKMSHLKFELDSAKADDDVKRQESLLAFTHGQEMDKIRQEQGFENSLVYFKDQLLTAQKAGDFVNAKILTKMQYDQENKLHQSISAVDQAKLQMEQEGLDMAKYQTDLENIKAEVEAGRLDPSDVTEFMTTVMGAALPDGFEFTEPAADALQKALTADYKTQQFQWALTQGDLDGDGLLDAGEYDENGTFTGLNNDNNEAFANHLTETIYNIEGGNPVSNKKIQIMTDGTGVEELATDPELHQAFLDDPTIIKLDQDWGNWGFSERFNGDGGKKRSIFDRFENNEFVNINGNIVVVKNIDRESTAGDDDTRYTILNPVNGKTVTIVASDRSKKRLVDLAGLGLNPAPQSFTTQNSTIS